MDVASVFRTLWEEICFAPEGSISGVALWRNVELRMGFTVDVQARLALTYRVSRIAGVEVGCEHPAWKAYCDNLEPGGLPDGAAPLNDEGLVAASEACNFTVDKEHTLEAAGLTDALKANSNPLTPPQMSALLCIARAGTVGMPLPALQKPTNLSLKQVHFVVSSLIGRGLIVKNASTYECEDAKGKVSRRFVAWVRLKKLSVPVAAASDSRPYLDAIGDVQRLLQQVPGQCIVAVDAAMALGWSLDLLQGVSSILNRMAPVMKAAQAWRLGLPGYTSGGDSAEDAAGGSSSSNNDMKDSDNNDNSMKKEKKSPVKAASPHRRGKAKGDEGAPEGDEGDGEGDGEGADLFGSAYHGSLRLLGSSGDSSSALLSAYFEALQTDVTTPFLAVARVAGASLADDPYSMPPGSLWPTSAANPEKHSTRIVFYLHRPPLHAAAAPAATAAGTGLADDNDTNAMAAVTRDAVLSPAKVLELVGITPASLLSPYSALLHNADWYAASMAAELQLWKLPEADRDTQQGLLNMSDDVETVPLALPEVPGDALPGGLIGSGYEGLETTHARVGHHHLAGAFGAVPEPRAADGAGAGGATAVDGLRFFRHRVQSSGTDASERPTLRGLLPSLAARDFNFPLSLWSTPGAAGAVPLMSREDSHDNAFVRALVAFGGSGPYIRTITHTMASRRRRLDGLWKMLRDAKLGLDMAVVPSSLEKSRLFSSVEVVGAHDLEARGVGPRPSPPEARDVLASGASSLSAAVAGGAVSVASFEVAAALAIVESLSAQSGVAQLLTGRVEAAPPAPVPGGAGSAALPSPRRGSGAALDAAAGGAPAAAPACKQPCDALQLVTLPVTAEGEAPKLLFAGSDRLRALQKDIIKKSRKAVDGAPKHVIEAAYAYMDRLPSAMVKGLLTEKRINVGSSSVELTPPPAAGGGTGSGGGLWSYSLMPLAAASLPGGGAEDAAAAQAALAAELLGLPLEDVVGPQAFADQTRAEKAHKAARKQRSDKGKKKTKTPKKQKDSDESDSASSSTDSTDTEPSSEETEAKEERVKRPPGRPRKARPTNEEKLADLADPTKTALNAYVLFKIKQALEAAYSAGALQRKEEMRPLSDLVPVPVEVREADKDREGSRRRYFWSDRAVLAMLKNYAAVQAFLEADFEQRYKRARLKWETGKEAEKEWFAKRGKTIPSEERAPPPLDAGELPDRRTGRKRSLFCQRPQPVLATPVMKWEHITNAMGNSVPAEFMTRLIKAINDRGGTTLELHKYAGWLKEEREKHNVTYFASYSSIGCARATAAGVAGPGGGDGSDRQAGAQPRRTSRGTGRGDQGGVDDYDGYETEEHEQAFKPPADVEIAADSFASWPQPAASLLAAARRVGGDGGLPTSVLPVQPPADAAPVPDALPWLGMETVATGGGYSAEAAWATGFSATAAAERSTPPAGAAPSAAAAAFSRALSVDVVGTTLGRLCFGPPGAVDATPPRALYAGSFKLAAAALWNEVLDPGSASFLGLLPQETTLRPGATAAFAAALQAIVVDILNQLPPETVADTEGAVKAVSAELEEPDKKGKEADPKKRVRSPQVTALIELQDNFCSKDIIASPQTQRLHAVNAAITRELEDIAAPHLTLKQSLIAAHLILHRSATDQRAEARYWLPPHLQTVMEQDPAWQQLLSGESGAHGPVVAAFTRALLESKAFTASFHGSLRRAIVRDIIDARLGVRSDLFMMNYYQPFSLEGLLRLKLPALATQLSDEGGDLAAPPPELDASDRWLRAAPGVAVASGALAGGVKLDVRLAPLEAEVAGLFSTHAAETVMKHEQSIINSRKRLLDKQKKALEELTSSLGASEPAAAASESAADVHEAPESAGVPSSPLAGSKRPRSPAGHPDEGSDVPSATFAADAAGAAMPPLKRARLGAAAAAQAEAARALQPSEEPKGVEDDQQDASTVLMQDSEDEDVVRLPFGAGGQSDSDVPEDEEEDDGSDMEDDEDDEEQGSDEDEDDEGEEGGEGEDGLTSTGKKAVSKLSNGITFLCSRLAALRKDLAVKNLGPQGEAYEPQLFFPFLRGSRAAAKVERQRLALQDGRAIGRLDASVIDFTPALTVSARREPSAGLVLTPPRPLRTSADSLRVAVHKLAAVVVKTDLNAVVVSAGLDGASLYTLLRALAPRLSRDSFLAAGISLSDALWLRSSPFALLAAVRIAAQKHFSYKPPAPEELQPQPSHASAARAYMEDDEEATQTQPSSSSLQSSTTVYAVPSVIGSLWVAGVAGLKTHTLPAAAEDGTLSTRVPLHVWTSPITGHVHLELLTRLALRAAQVVFDAVAPTEAEVVRALRAFHAADVRLLLRWLVKVGVLRRTFVVAGTATQLQAPPGAPGSKQAGSEQASRPAPAPAKKAVDLFAGPRVAPPSFAAALSDSGACLNLGSVVSPQTGLPEGVSTADAVALWESLYTPATFLQPAAPRVGPAATRCLAELAACDPDLVPIPGLTTIYTCAADAVVRAADLAAALLGGGQRQHSD